jgi:hypothetical protein
MRHFVRRLNAMKVCLQNLLKKFQSLNIPSAKDDQTGSLLVLTMTT